MWTNVHKEYTGIYWLAVVVFEGKCIIRALPPPFINVTQQHAAGKPGRMAPQETIAAVCIL